jgi:hypothetical protein
MTVKSTDTVFRAGHVEIEDVTIYTTRGFAQTITPQVYGIAIFEDIFNPFITGRLFIKDGQDLSNLLPLIGEETVKLTVRTNGLDAADTFDDEFYIYKLDTKALITERMYGYILHFTSKESIIDTNSKISKSYEGNIKDIVQSICRDEKYGLNTKKQIIFEETKNKIKYISNFWSPVQNIQYLADHAININDSPTFLFFENKYGLNFVSLDYLYTSTYIIQRFSVDNYTSDFTLNSSKRNIDKDFQRILKISPQSSYDYFTALKSGMYGSELITYDILTHQYTHVAYAPKFEDHSHLNEHALWTENKYASAQSVIMHGKSYYNNYENYDDVTNNKIIQKRKSLISQAEASKITITVHGNTAYSAGMRVYLDIPKRTQFSKTDTADDLQDKLVSGIYLIAALNHNIDRESHECTMELIKDSYLVDLNAK